ncbi:WD40 repeat domain-containing protein [Streptomyces canus]|uniref:WD40 repeat domain-containing protein n=1 Tax=Streptomyces canus TaxID=58343 RepID=UPI003AF3A2B2
MSEERQRLSGHSGWIRGCAFSPDGTLLATAGRDQTIRLWHMATGRCHCALRLPSDLRGLCWYPGAGLLWATGGAGVYMLTYVH